VMPPAGTVIGVSRLMVLVPEPKLVTAFAPVLSEVPIFVTLRRVQLERLAVVSPFPSVAVSGMELMLMFEPERAPLSVTNPRIRFDPLVGTFVPVITVIPRFAPKVGVPAMNWKVPPVGVLLKTLQRTVSVAGLPCVTESGTSSMKVFELPRELEILFPVFKAVPLALKSWHPERLEAVAPPLVVSVSGNEVIWTVPG
jgi:hypothetical protein